MKALKLAVPTVAAVGLVLALPLLSQTTGRIEGRVLDADSEVMASR